MNGHYSTLHPPVAKMYLKSSHNCTLACFFCSSFFENGYRLSGVVKHSGPKILFSVHWLSGMKKYHGLKFLIGPTYNLQFRLQWAPGYNEQISLHPNNSLLDKVMSHNQWHIGVQECHLMFKDPYMVIKRRCVCNKIFPLGQFMVHFTTFIMFLYTSNTSKASNGLQY